ncbi:hypothetical protein EDM80_07295 [bacterium]|nr:MAG: hypothetical protein EDM80_07295 [bacterium]RIK65422.1 MAG: hypothetical protein DCC64_01940 [Planctomycetota bacterium]
MTTRKAKDGTDHVKGERRKARARVKKQLHLFEGKDAQKNLFYGTEYRDPAKERAQARHVAPQSANGAGLDPEAPAVETVQIQDPEARP